MRTIQGVLVTTTQGPIVMAIDAAKAAHLVILHHYLHRRPPISHSYAMWCDGEFGGAVTYGVPASRHLQKSACQSSPDDVLELNRLWVADAYPANTESWFVARTLKMLPPRIVVSYADPLYGHYGYVYRALNFHYAGWTDMERKTPRFDYVPGEPPVDDRLPFDDLPPEPETHTRDAFRNGYVTKRRRVAKVKYWTVTGNRTDRRRLTAACGWPSLDWHMAPPPRFEPSETVA